MMVEQGKEYVCEDAGKALEELEEKLRGDRRKVKASRRSVYDEGIVQGLSMALKRIEDTKKNWKATWPSEFPEKS